MDLYQLSREAHEVITDQVSAQELVQNHLRNNLINCTKMIAPQTEIFQGMFETVINFTPSKSHVNL